MGVNEWLDQFRELPVVCSVHAVKLQSADFMIPRLCAQLPPVQGIFHLCNGLRTGIATEMKLAFNILGESPLPLNPKKPYGFRNENLKSHEALMSIFMYLF